MNWLLGLSLALGWSSSAVAGDPHVLVLGQISDDPKLHYEQLKPLLEYVVPRMADVGITEGRILLARDLQQMTSYLRRGRVDWVTATSANAVRLEQRAGVRMLALTERDGVASYRSITFVRRGSGIRSFADLRGHSIAFQNPSSTSAYAVPAIALVDAGLKMELLLSPKDRPDPAAVGYLFAGSELNISTWVHKGLVDAGAVSSLDWDNPSRMPPSYRDDFVVIGRSAPFPRALEMVRSDLDARIGDRLREVLLDAGTDPAARDAMQRFFGTTMFLPIDAATRGAVEQLGDGVARISEKVE
jgi:phosphonate transport system substrate-binding protein